MTVSTILPSWCRVAAGYVVAMVGFIGVPIYPVPRGLVGRIVAMAAVVYVIPFDREKKCHHPSEETIPNNNSRESLSTTTKKRNK